MYEDFGKGGKHLKISEQDLCSKRISQDQFRERFEIDQLFEDMYGIYFDKKHERRKVMIIQLTHIVNKIVKFLNKEAAPNALRLIDSFNMIISKKILKMIIIDFHQMKPLSELEKIQRGQDEIKVRILKEVLELSILLDENKLPLGSLDLKQVYLDQNWSPRLNLFKMKLKSRSKEDQEGTITTKGSETVIFGKQGLSKSASIQKEPLLGQIKINLFSESPSKSYISRKENNLIDLLQKTGSNQYYEKKYELLAKYMISETRQKVIIVCQTSNRLEDYSRCKTEPELSDTFLETKLEYRKIPKISDEQESYGLDEILLNRKIIVVSSEGCLQGNRLYFQGRLMSAEEFIIIILENCDPNMQSLALILDASSTDIPTVSGKTFIQEIKNFLEQNGEIYIRDKRLKKIVIEGRAGLVNVYCREQISYYSYQLIYEDLKNKEEHLNKLKQLWDPMRRLKKSEALQEYLQQVFKSNSEQILNLKNGKWFHNQQQIPQSKPIVDLKPSSESPTEDPFIFQTGPLGSFDNALKSMEFNDFRFQKKTIKQFCKDIGPQNNSKFKKMIQDKAQQFLGELNYIGATELRLWMQWKLSDSDQKKKDLQTFRSDFRVNNQDEFRNYFGSSITEQMKKSYKQWINMFPDVNIKNNRFFQPKKYLQKVSPHQNQFNQIQRWLLIKEESALLAFAIKSIKYSIFYFLKVQNHFPQLSQLSSQSVYKSLISIYNMISKQLIEVYSNKDKIEKQRTQLWKIFEELLSISKYSKLNYFQEFIRVYLDIIYLIRKLDYPLLPKESHLNLSFMQAEINQVAKQIFLSDQQMQRFLNLGICYPLCFQFISHFLQLYNSTNDVFFSLKQTKKHYRHLQELIVLYPKYKQLNSNEILTKLQNVIKEFYENLLIFYRNSKQESPNQMYPIGQAINQFQNDISQRVHQKSIQLYVLTTVQNDQQKQHLVAVFKIDQQDYLYFEPNLGIFSNLTKKELICLLRVSLMSDNHVHIRRLVQIKQKIQQPNWQEVEQLYKQIKKEGHQSILQILSSDELERNQYMIDLQLLEHIQKKLNTDTKTFKKSDKLKLLYPINLRQQYVAASTLLVFAKYPFNSFIVLRHISNEYPLTIIGCNYTDNKYKIEIKNLEKIQLQNKFKRIQYKMIGHNSIEHSTYEEYVFPLLNSFNSEKIMEVIEKSYNIIASKNKFGQLGVKLIGCNTHDYLLSTNLLQILHRYYNHKGPYFKQIKVVSFQTPIQISSQGQQLFPVNCSLRQNNDIIQDLKHYIYKKEFDGPSKVIQSTIWN